MTHLSRSSFISSLPIWCASLFLIACGGGGGSEGSGQEPDPVTVDLPIAYIERPLPADEDDPEALLPLDILDPMAFNAGAAVYLKPRATALAAAENITATAFINDENFTPEAPNYDVKDLSIHPDGDRLLFSMRAPEIPNADEEDQPKWGIWEYDLTTRVLRRVITSNIVADAGHDVSPRHLPDDRIVFSSTRQLRSRAMLLDDNKPQYTAQEEGNDGPAFVLHVMDGDGTNIQQITYMAGCYFSGGIRRAGATTSACIPSTPTAPTCNITMGSTASTLTPAMSRSACFARKRCRIAAWPPSSNAAANSSAAI
jgi:hypothetical protein